MKREKIFLKGEEYIFEAYTYDEIPDKASGYYKKYAKEFLAPNANGDWYCFLLKDDTMIGACDGELQSNTKATIASDLFITIVSSYRNKGLCVVFSTLIYKYLIDDLKVSGIGLTVNTDNMKGVTKCYVQSAISNNLFVYALHKGKFHVINTTDLSDSIDDFLKLHCCQLYFSVHII